MSASNLPPLLLVDDSEDDLHLTKRLLAKAGVKNPVVTFEEASGVVTFLKAASAAPNSGLMPCLVITDLKMPGMNGLELVQWIRGQRSLAGLPVVMLSGSGEEKDVKRAQALGVDKYLVKLPAPEVMAKIVADACQKAAKRGRTEK